MEAFLRVVIVSKFIAEKRVLDQCYFYSIIEQVFSRYWGLLFIVSGYLNPFRIRQGL